MSDRLRGILYLIGASFVFSLMSLVVKIAGETMPSQIMVLARGVVTLVLSYAWLRALRIPAGGKNRKLLVVRGLFGFGGLWCFYYAVTKLPLADVTVIHYVNPVLTALLAAVVLKERIGWPLAGAIGISLAGVLLVARPTWLFPAEMASALPPVAVGAALAGAAFSACAYVTVRKLRTTDDALVIVFWFPIVAVPATIPTVIPVWRMPEGVEWWLLLAVGVTTQIAQVFLTRGLVLVPAGRATAIGYTQILFATLWGVVFYHQYPTLWTLAGTILVFGGFLVVVLTYARRS